MNAILPDIRACNTPPFDADIAVSITVTGRGDVVDAQVFVGTPGDTLTPLAPDDARGPCIAQAVRRMRFDPFTDRQYGITFPFRL